MENRENGFLIGHPEILAQMPRSLPRKYPAYCEVRICPSVTEAPLFRPKSVFAGFQK